MYSLVYHASMFRVCIYVQYFLEEETKRLQTKKYIQELIKQRPKLHEKELSRKSVLNFDQ